MNYLKYFILILFATFFMSSCAKTYNTPYMIEPIVAKTIDKNTSRPVEITTSFNQSDPIIYFTFKIIDFPEGSKLKALWKYLNDGTEVSSEITVGGTGYQFFILKRSGDVFPAGQYEITVTAQLSNKNLEMKCPFEIVPEVKPVHLLNPMLSRSVDNTDNLTPVNITSEFTQDDSIIYFIIQSKDLPEGTKVSCTWFYKDTGDILCHEIKTEGNRNIGFSLKPESDQKLPLGKYIVTASINIDNKIESISKSFEIIVK